MSGVRFATLGITFGLLSFLVVANVESARFDSITQIAQSERGVSFVLHAPDGDPAVIERDNEPPAIEITGLSSVESDNGWLLPERVVWVGVPHRSNVTVESRTIDVEALEIDQPGRFPTESLREVSIEVGSPSYLRNQLVVPVSWTPLVAGPEGPLWERSVSVTLRFAGGDLRGRPGRSADRFEAVYRDLLINYDSARAWRRVPDRRSRVPTGDYFSTSTNPWLRIDIDHHGLYEITGNDLQGAQIDLAVVESEKLRIFTGSGLSLPELTPYTELPAWLNEIAIEVDDPDGQFDPQDRILFRGLGPDGWYAEYGVPDALYERYRVDEFSETNTYWLTWGDFEGEAKRWADIDGTDLPDDRAESARHRMHFEENKFWDPRPWEELFGTDLQIPDSLPFWEKWHWLEIKATSSNRRLSIPFSVPTPDPNGSASLLLRAWGASYTSGSLTPDHFLTIDLGGDSLAGGSWEEYDHIELSAGGIALAEEDQELGLVAPFVLDTLRTRIDHSYLAWFEVDYLRRLVFEDGELEFLVDPGTERVGFEIVSGEEGEIEILDVTDPHATKRIVPERPQTGSFTLIFGIVPDAASERRILVIDRQRAEEATIVRDTPPAGGYLRERTDAVDYILIAHELAATEAARLGEWREDHNPTGEPLSVAVVDVQDIYDEFSAGRVDPTSVRNFLHHASLNWNDGDPENGPAYVCILGDATEDFRNRRGQRGDLIVPTYEGYYIGGLQRSLYSPQFGSDDWLVLFDGPFDPALDMAIGRLPADSPASAAVLVDKVIAYESNQGLDDWRRRFTLVADDVCQGLEFDDLLFRHMQQTEALADDILPLELERDRVYLYEFGAECAYDRKPDATAALQSSIDNGTLVINYTGHGSEEQLADERVLETPNVAGMTNEDRLFFFLTASCSVGKFDFAGEGLAEALVRQPGGGAIGVFSSTTVAYSGPNAQLNREFFRAVYPEQDLLRSTPLGVASVIAKQSVPRPERIGNRRYTLLCEPAVRIASPLLRVALQMEGEGPDGTARADTIYRGALVSLTGQVENSAGQVEEGFNGTVSLLVYDSEILRDESIGGNDAIYNLNGAPIFRGDANVVAGRFESALLAPAALRSGEKGDALFYAYAVSGDGIEAAGGKNGIFVPELPPPQTSDTEGPVIEVHVAGETEELPIDARWEVTLTDSSGINITQLVPSRSVLLRIEEGSRTVHLEDLAPLVTFPESYQVGELEFYLPDELEAGRNYRLTVEASDNRDHRASASTEFTLAGGESGGLALGRIYNVPNPMEESTTFFLEISSLSDVSIRIFTAGGKQIQRIETGSLAPETAAASGIVWDGRDADGDRLANGVYFYKVSVTSESGKRASRIERLAVLR